MSVVVSVFRYLLPVLVVSIAVVLLCFYLHAKKKRAAYDVTAPTRPDDSTSSVVHSVSLSEDYPQEDRQYERLPPRYSTVDHPPPYSLFDPKLTSIWPGGPPPAYEMYPITLPLAPHHWIHEPPSSSSPSTHNHSHPQRPQQGPSGSTSF